MPRSSTTPSAPPIPQALLIAIMDTAARARRRCAAAGRVGGGLAFIAVVQAAICALAGLPVALGWHVLLAVVTGSQARAILVALLAVPTWCAFALALLVVSPLVMRAVGTRTPAGAVMRIADVEWRLMGWCHYAVAAHLVRVFAGSLFRGSPVWSFYLRLNGARIGRRVYVNSVHLADHHLLELGDDVVVGAEAHLSGHTVEHGIVRTAPVRVGPGATIGIGSIVEIGAEIGARCVVGALTFVPKFATLSPGLVYAGIPAHVLESTGPVDGGGHRPHADGHRIVPSVQRTGGEPTAETRPQSPDSSTRQQPAARAGRSSGRRSTT